MKKYKFLLKPLFFIFNLLFATFLVLTIEKIQPSDFGKHKRFFGSTSAVPGQEKRKLEIEKMCNDYKAGVIDSIQLDKRLDHCLNAYKPQ
jgi:hypothetical protein